jgi:hypothetical protein
MTYGYIINENGDILPYPVDTQLPKEDIPYPDHKFCKQSRTEEKDQEDKS